MAGRVLTDEKIRARKLFVDDGITSFTDLEAHTGVTRQTLSKWAKEEEWTAQRTSTVTSVENITVRMLGVLEKYLVQIEQMQSNGEPLSPKTVRQLKDMVDSVAALKKDFDERGGVISMFKKLSTYLAQLKGERDLRVGLQRIAPGFFSYIER